MGLKITKSKAQYIPKIIGWAAIIILVILMAKVWLWENTYYNQKTNEVRADAAPVLTEVASVVHPSEQKPTDAEIADYQVEVELPRYLDIPRLDIHARIKKSEVDRNTLPLPESIYDSMWYAGSARPGQGRTVIISGLAYEDTPDCLFNNLTSLEPGDQIQITNGNNFVYTYEVVELRIIEDQEVTKQLYEIQSQIDDTETLSLVSASQKVYEDTHVTYTSVGIVRAILKSSTQIDQ